eukprot:COSAG01_NODE_173_length_23099_cov_37.564783_12_plen_57_part_00
MGVAMMVLVAEISSKTIFYSILVAKALIMSALAPSHDVHACVMNPDHRAASVAGRF